MVRQSGTGHKAVCWALCVSVTVTKERECKVCQKSVPGKLSNTTEYSQERKAKLKPQICKSWVVQSLDWSKKKSPFLPVSIFGATSTLILLRTRCCGRTTNIHQAHFQLISRVKTADTREANRKGLQLSIIFGHSDDDSDD